MNKITFCIPSKNNLRYLKNSVTSIRENSEIEHDIIVYLDADNDGTEGWLIENQVTYIKNSITEPRGIAFGYNRCIEAAKTDIVCTFHADMYMAKGFDTAILKHLTPGKVICATRIEPPLHPKAKEKLIENFGMYPEDFQKKEFDEFAEKTALSNRDITTRGIFAPWAAYKEDVMKIGMHDEVFHSYHEDSDIFNRFILNGYEMIQTWEGFVYHLTCRGGQFQDGIEKVTTDPSFHSMKSKAFSHYLRKWGSVMINDEYQHPFIPGKYNIAFIVRNCVLPLLQDLEPWCDKIYVDEVFEIGRMQDYIEAFQETTPFDLRKRVHIAANNSPEEENDIVVEFDAKKLTQYSFNLLTQLPRILKDSGQIGKFQLDIFTVTINSLSTYEERLINLNDPYYTNQLL